MQPFDFAISEALRDAECRRDILEGLHEDMTKDFERLRHLAAVLHRVGRDIEDEYTRRYGVCRSCDGICGCQLDEFGSAQEKKATEDLFRNASELNLAAFRIHEKIRRVERILALMKIAEVEQEVL